MCVKWSEFSCGQTMLQCCCCLIAILTACETFMKISHRKGSTRVKKLPWLTSTWRHGHHFCVKLLYSAYLSQILWYKRYLYFVALRCMCINPTLHPSHSSLPISPSVLNHNYSSFKIFSDYKQDLISNFFPFLAEEVKRMTGSHFSHIFFLD